MPLSVLPRSRRYRQEVIEPVARAPGLGECIPDVVHGLGDELEGRAILLIHSVRAGLSMFSMFTHLMSYGLAVA